jgi:hypothetical protein
MFFRSNRGIFQFGRARLHGREATLDLLRQIAKSDSGKRYLKSVLIDELSKVTVAAMSDEEITSALAARITSGKLAFVHHRPSETRVEGFFVEGEGTSVLVGPQNKAGDTHPSPEIPPEYPVLARVESDQIIESTSQLLAKLAALLFVAFARQKRPSTIAAAYVSVASEEQRNIQASKNVIDASLDAALYPGGDLARKKPSVPVELVSAAKSTGAATKFAVDKLAASFADAAVTKKTARPAPALPEVFVNVAEATGSGTKSTVAALGGALAAMFVPAPFVRVRGRASAEESSG